MKQPATMPVISMPADEDIEDGVASVEYHGIPGLFFTFEAWKNVLIRQRMERKSLELAVVSESVDRQNAEAEAATLRKSQKMLEWRATWGVPLAFAGGATVATVLAALLFAFMPK